MMEITKEDFEKHLEFRDKINNTDLSDIQLIVNGALIEVSEDEISEWKYTGLDNYWFIQCKLDLFGNP